jgi:hypothetical protein
MNPRDPNDPPKPPAGILGHLDIARFSEEQRAELEANSDAAAQWLADLKALAMWVPTGWTQ